MNYFFVGFGIMAVCLGISAYVKLEKLVKKLKSEGIIEEGWENK